MQVLCQPDTSHVDPDGQQVIELLQHTASAYGQHPWPLTENLEAHSVPVPQTDVRAWACLFVEEALTTKGEDQKTFGASAKYQAIAMQRRKIIDAIPTLRAATHYFENHK